MKLAIAAPSLRATTLAVRAIQIIFSLAISVIFIFLLSSSTINSPRAELGVLLAFTLISLMQATSALMLTIFSREALYIAILDMVCLCGFMTAAVMARGVAEVYKCERWMGGDGEVEEVMMKRAEEALVVEGIGRRSGGVTCGLLKAVFGIAVVQCLSVLAAGWCTLLIVRERRRVAEKGMQ